MKYWFVSVFAIIFALTCSYSNTRKIEQDSLEVIPSVKSIDTLWVSSFYETMVPCLGNYTGRLDSLETRIPELNNKLTIKIPHNIHIERKLSLFLTQYEPFLRGNMYRSYYYFSLFESALERHNLPKELKYLAVIESGLNSHAKSWVGASGLWQFMHGTGRSFGLTINNYMDERNNPVEATEAACKYLKSLYQTFGDWGLAIAAYNSGPGGVRKAIKRSRGSKNFWVIRDHLPKETAHYFPSFLAVAYIFEYAKQIGFDYDTTRTFLSETELVGIKKTSSLFLIAEKIGLDAEILSFLNPSYKKGVVPVLDESRSYVRLPKSIVSSFNANEDLIYESSSEIAEFDPLFIKKSILSFTSHRTSQKRFYVVRKGDTLSEIAGKYKGIKGISARSLMTWNHLKSSKIKPGMKIRLTPS